MPLKKHISNPLPHPTAPLETIRRVFQEPCNTAWCKTTYPINHMVSTKTFRAQLSDTPSSEKPSLGYPSDYARLGNHYSYLLEYYCETVFASKAILFGSPRMAFLSVILTRADATTPVHLCFQGDADLNASDRAWLSSLNVMVTERHDITRPAPQHADQISVFIGATYLAQNTTSPPNFDGIVYLLDAQNSMLFVRSTAISPDDAKLIRKRLSTTALPQMSYALGRQFLTLDPPSQLSDAEKTRAQAAALEHKLGLALNRYYGTSMAVSANSGLAMETALFLAVKGDHDTLRILSPNDPYGGTKAALGLLHGLGIRDHSVKITNGSDKRSVFVKNILEELAENPEEPTAIFLELPSNPDLHITDLQALVDGLSEHQKAHHTAPIPVIVDVTLSSANARCDFNWPVIFTQSASKALSTGLAVGGVAYATREADDFLIQTQMWVSRFGNEPSTLLTQSVIDQMPSLTARVTQAHEKAVLFSEWYKAYDPAINYISGHPDITPAVVSFFLPEKYRGEEKAFIAFLVARYPDHFVNCVSYGQVQKAYIITPFDSTQGALTEADKDSHKLRLALGSESDVAVIQAAFLAFFNPPAL